jgi:hypothetical protein
MTSYASVGDAGVDPRRPGQPLGLECDVCGFRGSTLGPGDAVVAVRSLPRRYRAAFGLSSDEVDEMARRRPAPGWWSALELAGHVRDVLHAKEKRLRRINFEDAPAVGEEHETPPTGVDDQGVQAILSALQYNAEQLARAAESVSGKDWLRTGQRQHAAVTALDLLREAVHEGVHHLRDLDRVLCQAREGFRRDGGMPTDQ